MATHRIRHVALPVSTPLARRSRDVMSATAAVLDDDDLLRLVLAARLCISARQALLRTAGAMSKRWKSLAVPLQCIVLRESAMQMLDELVAENKGKTLQKAAAFLAAKRRKELTSSAVRIFQLS